MILQHLPLFGAVIVSLIKIAYNPDVSFCPGVISP
jgi:hypothetical protein